MATREAFVTVAVPDSILRLVEGDRVLVVMRSGYTQDQLDSFAAKTRERFPGVEFTFVTGVQQIAVQQADKETTEPPTRTPPHAADMRCPRCDAWLIGDETRTHNCRDRADPDHAKAMRDAAKAAATAATRPAAKETT